MLPSQMPSHTHQRMQRLRIRDRFGGAAHVRLGDDFQQRRAGAVQVDAGHAREVFVQRLAGVFFEVRARQVDVFSYASLPAFSLAGTWIVDVPPCTTGISYWLIW